MFDRCDKNRYTTSLPNNRKKVKLAESLGVKLLVVIPYAEVGPNRPFRYKGKVYVKEESGGIPSRYGPKNKDKDEDEEESSWFFIGEEHTPFSPDTEVEPLPLKPKEAIEHE